MLLLWFDVYMMCCLFGVMVVWVLLVLVEIMFMFLMLNLESVIVFGMKSKFRFSVSSDRGVCIVVFVGVCVLI